MRELKFKVPVYLCVIFSLAFMSSLSDAQTGTNDSIKFDYPSIYSFCLDADVNSALKLIDVPGNKKISAKDREFKTQFEQRFKFFQDNGNYPDSGKYTFSHLLKIYRDYWRLALLNPSQNYDHVLIENLGDFLAGLYPNTKKFFSNEDTLDVYLKRFTGECKFKTTGFGKTGKLYDFLVWSAEKDTIYNFQLHDEKISARVFMMDNFITLGWEEYATLARYYPGGWATKEALYCVKKAYDLNSEDFLISYLAHESRHFSDYRLFPNLKSADLEYRAKLTELSLAKTTLFETIKFFIDNSVPDNANAHPLANYCVIRDLCKAIFNNEFEKDITKWKGVGSEKINEVSYKLLTQNTKALKDIGPAVETYIKVKE